MPSAWYRAQYPSWDRLRRMHTTPFIARPDSNTAAAAVAMHNADQDVVINMGDLTDKDVKKQQDPLFGPNIGVVSAGPEWADINDKKAAIDQLSPDIVKAWIERSKEASHPTTTLQALVNLRRPSLRLSPLAMDDTDDPDRADFRHHHGLEFEYDCDAPKCGIYVHVLLAPDHPLADPKGALEKGGLQRVLVFESVVEGGFGKILKLAQGATLELGRFEDTPDSAAAGPHPVDNSAVPTDPTTSVEGTSGRQDRRRRFTNFHFGRRTDGNHSVSGPALAVLDGEVGAHEKDKAEHNDGDGGVKVTIRLAALDQEGKELPSPNEQITYLHVVRYGTRNTDEGEDSRPWVVKVVKREATIGVHTFHLHEIYGLSSQSSAPSAHLPPTAPAPSSPTTYPPTAASAPTQHQDEVSSECLLCLSSPREVVLLPCRHLVACKECAINMVEFGAGGAIVHNDSETGGDGDASGAGGSSADAAIPAPVVAAPANPRRKRKAKGWFCPVCRQPYTSLLRITTTPPEKEAVPEPEPVAAADDATGEQGIPLPASTPSTRAGLSSLRPNFLRNISRSTTTSRPATAQTQQSTTEPALPAPSVPPDLERGEAAPSISPSS